MKRGNLIVISAASGTGKGTICQKLFEKKDNVIFSVSMTTRKPRPGEKHGKDYYFVSKEEFEGTIADSGFLEYAKVFNNFYGTPKGAVTENLKAGKHVLLEIDVQGAMAVKNACNEAILIFILPPSMEELKNRIINRGTETEESLKLRLGEAKNEIRQACNYDYIVINDDIDKAVDDVLAILHSRELEAKNFNTDFE